MGLTYRKAALQDAELASDITTAAYPAMPQDPVITRVRWTHPRHGFVYGRFLAERGGKTIAFVAFVHGPWELIPDRHCEIEVRLDRGFLDRDLLIELVGWIDRRATEEETRLLFAYCAEDENEMRAALAANGYAAERVERVWELDLLANGARLVAEARAARERMDAAGVSCTTLGAWRGGNRLRKLYELSESTIQDVPHTLSIVPETFDDFEQKLSSPDRPWDRFWIALAGDRPVAMSYLKFPPVRGTVWTGYTCTAGDFRGQGVARAIKLQSLAQAAELGVPLVCTDNDSENAPILRINQGLGYRPRPGFVQHLKRVTN